MACDLTVAAENKSFGHDGGLLKVVSCVCACVCVCFELGWISRDWMRGIGNLDTYNRKDTRLGYLVH